MAASDMGVLTMDQTDLKSQEAKRHHEYYYYFVQDS